MKHTILNTQHNSTQYTHHTMNTTIQQTPCFVNPILNTPYKKATQKQHNTKTQHKTQHTHNSQYKAKKHNINKPTIKQPTHNVLTKNIRNKNKTT